MNGSVNNKLELVSDEFTIFRLKKKILKFMAKSLPGYRLRAWLLRKCNYRIGRDVFIGEELLIIDDLRDASISLSIGDRVAIAPRVTLVLLSTPNWSKIADYVSAKKGKIAIENDAWLGTGAIIMPDITIGEGAVVSANSVVTKDIPPYTIVGGIPAKKLKSVSIP